MRPKRPGQNSGGSADFTKVNADNIETHIPQFVKFYKGIELVPEEEWKHFVESLFTSLPLSFRIMERSSRINCQFEGRPGVVAESEVLKQFLKNSILPKVAGVTVDDKPFEMKAASWFPKEMLWSANAQFKSIVANQEMKSLKKFLIDEKVNSLMKQDVVSMIPPLMVDIQSHHKILEMHATGAQTVQILEQLMANPKQLPSGILISNNREVRRNYGGWHQSTNNFTIRTLPEKIPDIYTKPDNSPESKLAYDRIFLKASTSDDGLMRTVLKIRTNWNNQSAYKNHEVGRKSLKRGVELLATNGQLVYFTHSMNPLENEAVVSSLLDEADGNLQLVDVRKRFGDFNFRPGMSSWKVMSQGLVFYDSFDTAPAWFQKENSKTLFASENAANYNLDRCVRVMPHDNDTQALFVAVISKTGAMPWVIEAQVKEAEAKAAKAEAEAAKAEASKAEAMEVDASGEGKEAEAKCPYKLPVRVDINVSVTEIEWTTEVTDDNLDTKSDVNLENFDLPEMKISRLCIPSAMWKKMQDEKYGLQPVAADNPEWDYIKKLYDIKRFDPLPNMMQYKHVRHENVTIYCYCSPILRSIIASNKELVSKCRAGQVLIRGNSMGKPTLNNIGYMALLPYMNKRMLTVPITDVKLALQDEETAFNKFSPRTKVLLEAMDEGPVLFYYEPKGKNPDPKCCVYFERERSATTVKKIDWRKNLDNHCLRLCGIEPEGEVADEKSEHEDEDMEVL